MESELDEGEARLQARSPQLAGPLWAPPAIVLGSRQGVLEEECPAQHHTEL